jgi:hypothetical protein
VSKKNVEIFNPSEDVEAFQHILERIEIKDEEITIQFDYPLSKSAKIKFKQDGGFTLVNLMKCIRVGYHKIYDEETAAVGDPGCVEGMYNRSKSSGPYGIWGHDICDLVVEGIYYNEETKTVTLQIGS